MCTTPAAPGAAKFLMNWPATNVNITAGPGVGVSFLDLVRLAITDISEEMPRPVNSEQIPRQFLLQQWREIEEMLVERGSADTGTTTFGRTSFQDGTVLGCDTGSRLWQLPFAVAICGTLGVDSILNGSMHKRLGSNPRRLPPL